MKLKKKKEENKIMHHDQVMKNFKALWNMQIQKNNIFKMSFLLKILKCFKYLYIVYRYRIKF